MTELMTGWIKWRMNHGRIDDRMNLKKDELIMDE